MLNIVGTIKTAAKRVVVKDWENQRPGRWWGLWLAVVLVVIATALQWHEYPWNGNPFAWVDANQRYDLAKAAAGKRDVALATSKLREAIRIYPGDKRFHAELARQLTHENALSEAIDAWQRCLAVDPNQPAAWVSLAQLYAITADMPKANEAVAKALKIDAGSAEAHAMKALLLLSENKTAEAQKEFDKTARAERDTGRFWNLAGTYYARLGKAQEAESALRQAAEMDPTNAMFQSSLGSYLLEQKKFPEAETHLYRASRLDPEGSEYFARLAEARFHQGKLKTAIEALAVSSSLQPANWKRLEELGRLQMRDKDYSGAVESFKRGVEIVPARAKMWDELINALSLAGRDADAKVAVVRFINLSPENASNAIAWKYLGLLLEKEGNIDDAKGAFQRAIALSRSKDLTAFCQSKIKTMGAK